VTVRVRLGAGLTRLSAAPFLTLSLPDGATVADLFAHLGETSPELAPALRSVLHVTRDQPLADRQEVALLLPVSGG